VRLSARELNRATLHRQLLLERARLPVAEAVHRVTALQAQEPASPYLALWSRVEGFDPAQLDDAFARASVVKASLMRLTLHAVEASDYPPFHAAMRGALRASRLYDRRFRDTGLAIADVDAYESELLASSTEPRTTPQLIAVLEKPFGEAAKRAWWAYRTYLALHHAPGGGPWSFSNRSAFVAAPSTLPAEARQASLDVLVRRYLQGFGPATIADISRFTLLARATMRDAIERLGEQLIRHEGPDGAELLDVRGMELAPDVPAPPRLLPMWDSVLLAYDDRSRVLPLDLRPLVIRRNGDVLPTLLVDGHVAGVWRFVDDAVEATTFEPLARESWTGLAREAGSLVALLRDRDPGVYRRYHHWWQQLPDAAEVRSLP
jgi:hypothetical protein